MLQKVNLKLRLRWADNRYPKGAGFTVMELVVAAGVFVMFLVLSLGVFSFSLRGQRRVLVQSRLDREAQLIMETIAKKIRSAQVDYAAYAALGGIPDPPNSVNRLILRDATNIQYDFQLSTDSIDLGVDGAAAVPISSAQVAVTDLDFFIQPTQDPFQPGQSPTTQPRVTMVLSLQASQGQTQVVTIIEQTVPQRGGAY